MADVDQNCDFLLRIFSQDTTIGRTFVNIFANDDLLRRNHKQQQTISEQQTPSKSIFFLIFIKYVSILVNIFADAVNLKEHLHSTDLDGKRIDVMPIRPQPYITKKT
jgi:hypothetical protein